MTLFFLVLMTLSIVLIILSVAPPFNINGHGLLVAGALCLWIVLILLLIRQGIFT